MIHLCMPDLEVEEGARYPRLGKLDVILSLAF
jgi:hypothetical protein